MDDDAFGFGTDIHEDFLLVYLDDDVEWGRAQAAEQGLSADRFIGFGEAMAEGRRLIEAPGSDMAARLDAIAAETEEDDVVTISYTSGTTGFPKGVMLTHRNVCVHAGWAISELGLTARDVWGHFAPMFHLADAWATFAITEVGGLHVMCGRFEAGEALSLIERHRITTSNLIPTMLALMCSRDDLGDRDLSSLRVVLSGGAPIAPELVRRIVERLGLGRRLRGDLPSPRGGRGGVVRDGRPRRRRDGRPDPDVRGVARVPRRRARRPGRRVRLRDHAPRARRLSLVVRREHLPRRRGAPPG